MGDYKSFRPFFANSDGASSLFELTRLALNMAESAEKLPDSNIQSQLNDAKPHYDYGLMKLRKGRYYYMSTRNNNISNRSQKGQVQVKDNDNSWWSSYGWVVIVGCSVFAAIRPNALISRPMVMATEWVSSFVNH